LKVEAKYLEQNASVLPVWQIQFLHVGGGSIIEKYWSKSWLFFFSSIGMYLHTSVCKREIPKHTDFLDKFTKLRIT